MSETNYKFLNDKLMEHYECFKTQRFYLEDVTEEYCFINTTSISDPCPFQFCRNIAKYIKKVYSINKMEPPIFIYVGPWIFETEVL